VGQYRLAGPTCGGQQSLQTQDGTLPRMPGCAPGAVQGAQPHAASGLDPLTLWHRAACVHEASGIGLALAPAAIAHETGYELRQLLQGLLPGLLTMVAVVGATAALGGVVGAAIGALAGGVGAVPGAAAGATLGTDLGMALLGWLGLGFLAVAIGRGLGEVSGMVTQAVRLAWDAHGTPRRNADVQAAGALMARAVARLMLLILMAIVARLTLGQAAGASGRAANSANELIAALRQSRLGAGFADWVAANAQSLVRNPRLRPHRETGAGVTTRSQAATPSQLRPAAPPPPPPPAAAAPAPAGRPQSARTRYMGRTPGKNSPTGLKVQERMRADGTLRDNVVTGKPEILASDGRWQPLSKADMTHVAGKDAVTEWNQHLRQFGAKAPEVRAFMLNPDNYTLDYYRLNRSAGAVLGQTERYLPPLK